VHDPAVCASLSARHRLDGSLAVSTDSADRDRQPGDTRQADEQLRPLIFARAPPVHQVERWAGDHRGDRTRSRRLPQLDRFCLRVASGRGRTGDRVCRLRAVRRGRGHLEPGVREGLVVVTEVEESRPRGRRQRRLQADPLPPVAGTTTTLMSSAAGRRPLRSGVKGVADAWASPGAGHRGVEQDSGRRERKTASRVRQPAALTNTAFGPIAL